MEVYTLPTFFSMQTMDVLKEQLAESGVDFTEKLFNTEDGIDGLSGGIFVSIQCCNQRARKS